MIYIVEKEYTFANTNVTTLEYGADIYYHLKSNL
jgi:hypothetical protein